jgi:hypothetical protein
MPENKATIIVEGNEVKNYLIRIRDYTQSLVSDLNTNIADLEAKIEAANTTPVEGESING